jgi:hypothetical protein
VYTPEVGRIDLVTVYGKDEADDLTSEQLKALCKVAALLREEARTSLGRKVAKREDKSNDHRT